MAKGALYWRMKDEKTGKWTYKKIIRTYSIDEELLRKAIEEEE